MSDSYSDPYNANLSTTDLIESDDSTESCNGCEQVGCAAQPEISREKFIKIALAGLTVCWGAMAAYPLFLYLNPKKGENDEKMNITSLEVCKVAELPAGSGKNFRFGSIPALLIHTDDGQFHAFKAVCTHLGCTVQYRDDKHHIYCACHGGEYDPTSGKNIAGPPPKPLPALAVAVKNGMIVVSKT
jgi:nitrite reductase/ring-hydroxylating ferredoxin subunit